MENQSNLDLEQTSPVATLISTVGQWQLPEAPFLNQVYNEPGLQLYLFDPGIGELQFHADIKGDITKSRLKHFEEVFIMLIALLADRGMTELKTWIEKDNQKQKRLAEFFGFYDTGYLKILEMEDGSQKVLEELLYTFPLDDGDED